MTRPANALQEKPWLVVLAGPTAVGKTQLALALAQHYQTEILSTDSRQFYREMHIGTAKPSAKELRQVPHHLVDSLSIEQPYDVKQFETDALQTLNQLFASHPLVIATGGSGLFIQTLCEGIDDIPDISPAIRDHWQQQLETHGLVALAEKLKDIDPDFYGQADLQNPRRVLRALEVYEATGLPYSSFRKGANNQTQRPFNVMKIGLSRDRHLLYARIDQRVDDMLTQGLEAEARDLYPYRQLNALQTVGYQELFPYIEGVYDLAEAVRLIKRNTRRYAKRQLTWFRKDDQMQWFDLTEQQETQALAAMIRHIEQQRKDTSHEPAP